MADYTHFFSLFSRARRTGAVVEKDHHELVRTWSNGTRKGLKELSYAELREITDHIQALVNPAEASAQRMRRKVIAILSARGYIANGRPDMPRIYGWVNNYGYAHKPLNKYTNAELTLLVTQAEKVALSDMKAHQ